MNYDEMLSYELELSQREYCNVCGELSDDFVSLELNLYDYTTKRTFSCCDSCYTDEIIEDVRRLQELSDVLGVDDEDYYSKELQKEYDFLLEKLTDYIN